MPEESAHSSIFGSSNFIVSDKNSSSRWLCMYDVASNGNTITCVGFRNGGMELMSKSNGMNLRVWDISNYEDDPTSKPSYEDINNSHDVKCLLSQFALGGTYEFAAVKIDAPKEANRLSLKFTIYVRR
jgi:hypothetical protein